MYLPNKTSCPHQYVCCLLIFIRPIHLFWRAQNSPITIECRLVRYSRFVRNLYRKISTVVFTGHSPKRRLRTPYSRRRGPPSCPIQASLVWTWTQIVSKSSAVPSGCTMYVFFRPSVNRFIVLLPLHTRDRASKTINRLTDGRKNTYIVQPLGTAEDFDTI